MPPTTMRQSAPVLVKPNSGSVTVDGVDVLTDLRRATGLVGIAPQYTGIYPPLSVRETSNSSENSTG